MQDRARYETLPKWAQEEISLRDRRIAELRAQRAKLEALHSHDEDTDTYIQHHEREDTLLPMSSRVSFKVGGSRFDVQTRGDHVEVYQFGDFIGEMVIKPMSSNHVALKVVAR